MKYPECCYRIGNGLEWCGRLILPRECSEKYVYCFGDGKVRHEDVELVSITAETLASLASENEESITWDTYDNQIKIYRPSGDGYMAYITIKRGESLGKFFLRVAKECNYIK